MDSNPIQWKCFYKINDPVPSEENGPKIKNLIPNRNILSPSLAMLETSYLQILDAPTLTDSAFSFLSLPLHLSPILYPLSGRS